MNILAFLTDRRPQGAAKGAATRKLARKMGEHARSWADPAMLQLIPFLIKKNGGEYIDERAGITRRYTLEEDSILFRQANGETNRDWALSIAFDGAGGFEWQSVEGSIRGFADHHDFDASEIRALIDEAKNTGYSDDEEAMIERLGLE